MKLISYKHAGTESWGAVSGDTVLDLASASGIATLAEFVGSPAFKDRDAVASAAEPPPGAAISTVGPKDALAREAATFGDAVRG